MDIELGPSIKNGKINFGVFHRSLVFCVLLNFSSVCSYSQIKIPFLFRQQERFVSKHIHRYLKNDTLVETTAAKIHIHYSKNKNLPYLLVLHGLGANGRSNWFKQIAYLSKRFNLLIPDLIYFGESTSKENKFSPEFQVEQINQVIKQLNISEKIHVMGFSYGGLVAATYNLLFVEEVKKLVIIDGPVKFFSGRMADSVAILAGASNITDLLVPQTVDAFKALQKAAYSRKVPTTKRFKRKLIAQFFTPSLETRQKLITHLIAHEAFYQSSNYNFDLTRTLFVWGAKDGVVPVSVGKSLYARFPATCQLTVFKKAKHDALFRYSKSLNKRITKFLLED